MNALAAVIQYQWADLPITLDKEACRGRTYIVTGANIGLGFECVKHLVRFGSARVIMAVRSTERGQAALESIEADTGTSGVAEVWPLDLTSYQSIQDFAKRVEGLDRVNALVHNAGVANEEWTICEEGGGLETSLMVNLVGPLYLTSLLMPYLEACAERLGIQPRITFVNSRTAFTRKEDLDKIGDADNILHHVNDPSKWSMDGMNRYGLSKLLQLLAVRHLPNVFSGTRTIINTVGPGLCSTGLLRNSTLATRIKVGIAMPLLGQTAEWGSRNLLFGIAAGSESHGKYLAYCEIRDEWVPEWISDETGRALGSRIWEAVSAEFERAQPK